MVVQVVRQQPQTQPKSISEPKPKPQLVKRKDAEELRLDRERQHSMAMEMIQSKYATMEKKDLGEIPLPWKRCPTILDPYYCNALDRAAPTDNCNIKAIDGGGRSRLQVEEEEKKNYHPDATTSTDDDDCNLNQCENESIKIQYPNNHHDSNNNNNNNNHDQRYCVSSRGMVDVKKIASLITEGSQDTYMTSSSSTATSASTSTTTKSCSFQNHDYSGTNLWDERNARENNVHITRPSHDAWGIKKIALIFCDDFLHQIYEMPWWHSHPSMQEAVQPILDKLQIESHQIVRLLLAALPPGATIPVHHDTGNWVSQTHRVHVPILVDDPDLILFRCGPDEDHMQRVSCDIGHVFEINNQAKHAVSNCHPSHHRVHLILDYINMDRNTNTNINTNMDIQKRNHEKFYHHDNNNHIHRVQLSPGEILRQTRRSIDREIEMGNRPIPSFLILGAQKCGTTSLYDYINQHPLVVRARRRETHCLDWRWNDKLQTTKQRQEWCKKFFYAKELYEHPSCMTGESTPSYLLDSERVIPRLKEVFPHVSSFSSSSSSSSPQNNLKFIVMLRDPIRRAVSQVAMVQSVDGTEEQKRHRGTEWLTMSFEDIVHKDIFNMKQDGLLPHWNTITQTCDMDIFRKFAGSKEEDDAFRTFLQRRVILMSGSHSLISRGLYELQLRQWFHAFPIDQFLVMKLEDMYDNQSETNQGLGGGGAKEVANRAFAHIGLPPYEIDDESAKNTRSYGQIMKDETKKMLERFYAPYNERLAGLLGEQDWSNTWNYSMD